ncbi:hypothetical protein GCM10025867_02320 [Frondihabitans sucicola]|uniref:Anti-sigma factor n=1 Tax=Frondihabitans sucicola TaxID=1268041 RepID=A0ABM8GHZ7_9MICO|nr:hypothetical protein [Frondihabitans sucicola]BDZ47991.1 hypothetical protein GCM10025867_02320 [Frondihabitans sucicola]
MLNDERRRALELLAYGQTASPAESAAARHELEADDAARATAALDGEREGRALDAAGPDEAPSDGTLAGSVGDAAVPEGERPGDAGADPAPSRWRPSRRVFVTGLGAALVVGLIGGALVDRVLLPPVTGSSAAPSFAPSLDPSPSVGSELFDGDPSVVASSREKILAAEALLARSATSEDRYAATPGANITYVPSSTRLVATTPAKTRIWIAREAGSSGGYCLLSLDGSESPNAGLGLSSCSLPDEFVSSGVVLSANGYDVTWKGGRVTVAVGN